MKAEDLYEVFRRYHQGQSIIRIADREDRDRKTVRYYPGELKSAGFSREKAFPEKEMIYRETERILPERTRERPAREELKSLEEEIRELINPEQKKAAMKPKTAYLAIREKHGIVCSYATFKV